MPAVIEGGEQTAARIAEKRNVGANKLGVVHERRVTRDVPQQLRGAHFASGSAAGGWLGEGEECGARNE